MTRPEKQPLHNMSETLKGLKNTGIALLKKVPDFYFDAPTDNSSMSYHLKRTEGSAYSTSCTSHSTETNGSVTTGEASRGNTTISTRESMMLPGITVSPSMPTTVAANTTSYPVAISPQSNVRPILLVSQSSRDDDRSEKKELLFEVATHLETPADTPKEAEASTEGEDEASSKTRRLTLLWDEAQAVARRAGQSMPLDNLIPHHHACDTFELPPGITRDDILVTIDIDDTARSSRALEMVDEDMDVQPRNRCDTGTVSHTSSAYTSSTHQEASKLSQDTNQSAKRRNFEEAVRQGIQDDLRSIYTATPETAKLVLCIVICVLSDGSMQHTFWSGGRVGLAELALNWRLFGADDLKMYEGGLVVQRKDFGFGPLALSQAEGEYFMVTKMAPLAANDIVRRIGGASEDCMVEI